MRWDLCRFVRMDIRLVQRRRVLELRSRIEHLMLELFTRELIIVRPTSSPSLLRAKIRTRRRFVTFIITYEYMFFYRIFNVCPRCIICLRNDLEYLAQTNGVNCRKILLCFRCRYLEHSPKDTIVIGYYTPHSTCVLLWKVQICRYLWVSDLHKVSQNSNPVCLVMSYVWTGAKH